ncbi:hypothetical protein BHF71_03995 [Vulcanibacillus modesticaldus]|uniref:Uncharacterized protein n=1 Tax=Vulcanibacillus modesticaldus TaxID=337097 RepID=A0A1D2YS77_9BACI|nr:DUF2533 family protein [Vulcanibacillus modesticaldus]OEF96898.1 hypothetical protein BHF71_03995 [Vulcanibacillus modesticaldus]
MSVHNEISKQVEEKVQAIKKYQQMDEQRERIISQLIEDYKAGKMINLAKLNSWTKEMNQFAIKHQLPTRKEVTIEMFKNFIEKL